ncbi:MAG: TIGR04141 family sporadically distributed protein [Candidatus Omnitrophota bacterium]
MKKIPREKKNKLSIYLIKDNIFLDEIIDNDSGLIKKNISDSIFYIKPSASRRPSWIEKFFGDSITDQTKIFSSSSCAALIVPVKLRKTSLRYFALTFGTGFHLLQKGVYEERFGLKVVLNAVDQENIRSIDKINFGGLVKQSKEQVGKSATTSEFGINIEQDLIQAVTGLSNDLFLGKTISGRDSLHVSVPVTFVNIKKFLLRCLEYSNSRSYKKYFSWIDQIEEVRNPTDIERFNNSLVRKINDKNFDKLWIAVPEIIDWTDFDYFKYKTSQMGGEYRDLSLTDFVKEYEKHEGTFTIELLRKLHIYCYFENSPTRLWKIYNCLYAEISEKNSVYTLTNGKWYKIDKSFSAQIEKTYEKLLRAKSPIKLPGCPVRFEEPEEPVVEDHYNEYAAEKSGYALLDKKNVYLYSSPVEICDLYSSKKDFIHIKHYGGSNILSHLFNQGIVSAELFLADPAYRLEMNKRLPRKFQIKDSNKQINAEEYKIIYGIISSVPDKLKIPFFSKVSLKNIYLRLSLYRFKVYLQKIDIDRVVKLKEKKSKKVRKNVLS